MKYDSNQFIKISSSVERGVGLLILKQAGDGLVRAEVGRDVCMKCEYRMRDAGDTLYSIKWYRNDQEFFRYIPTGYRISLLSSVFFLSVKL